MLKAGILDDPVGLHPDHILFFGRCIWNPVFDTGLWAGQCGNKVCTGNGTSQCSSVHGMRSHNAWNVPVPPEVEMVLLYTDVGR